ncbi:hypothetical protein CPLU01_03242 [Colletotrichum plurivorum]|uniref:Uncharacterized protein n=1 Tax=Colletotrichum plurivorum TaxID=2175906 RepID=A0A8H6KT90_9PEZI|nr:hypothetical protein CPLU01_03242 [Colletotrichum plurivorum]
MPSCSQMATAVSQMPPFDEVAHRWQTSANYANPFCSPPTERVLRSFSAICKYQHHGLTATSSPVFTTKFLLLRFFKALSAKNAISSRASSPITITPITGIAHRWLCPITTISNHWHRPSPASYTTGPGILTNNFTTASRHNKVAMPILLRPSELAARRSAPVVAATGRAMDALPALKPSQAGVKKASSAAQKTTGARRAATTNNRVPLPDAPTSSASSTCSAASAPKSWPPWKELKHVNVFSSAAPSPVFQSRRRAASKKAIAQAKAEAAEKSMLFSMSSLKKQKSAHEVEMEGRRAQMRALGPVDATRR